MDGAGGTPVDIENPGEGEEAPSEAMSLDELTSWVKSNIDDSENAGSEMNGIREHLFDRYYGRKYGDEVDGFSQVVSRDVMETVEWMVAQLLRVFSGERFCEFEPFGPEDVKSAEQQTDFVNYIIMQECNGTLLLHDWFKEALLLRMGIVHWGYETIGEKTVETYSGLTQAAIEMLVQDEGTQVTAMTQTGVMPPTESTPPPGGPQQGGMPPGPPAPMTGMVPGGMPDGSMGQPPQPPPPPEPIYDVEITRIKREKKLRVVSVPGDEFLIQKNARTIDESCFTGHKTRATKSDLLKMGISQDVVDSLAFNDEDVVNGDSYARDNLKDTNSTLGFQNASQALTWLYTLYCKVDWDNDGIDELMRVRYAGGQILGVEPALEVPYADLCPVRTPHRFVGLGYGDMVEDIQRIKTVLWRAALDNAYLTVRPQKEVVEQDVNLNDLDTATVGGNIRVKRAGSINPIVTPPMMEHALSMMQHVDSVREDRTGLSAAAMGRDIEQVHDTARGQETQVSQAQMRIELVARMFAETGVKRLFVGLYNAIVRNQEPARMVRLRGKFVQIDPREWRERNNVIVNVALGAGTITAQSNVLTMIATMQQGLMEKGIPLVMPQNLQYTLEKLVEVNGYKNVQSFITPPENFPPPEPQPPPPEIQIAQMQVEIEREKRQTETQRAQMDMQAKAQQSQIDFQMAVLQTKQKEAQAERDFKLQLAKLKVSATEADEKREQESVQFYDKLMHDAILAREKMDADAEKAREQAAADERAMKAAMTDEPTGETNEQG